MNLIGLLDSAITTSVPPNERNGGLVREAEQIPKNIHLGWLQTRGLKRLVMTGFSSANLVSHFLRITKPLTRAVTTLGRFLSVRELHPTFRDDTRTMRRVQGSYHLPITHGRAAKPPSALTLTFASLETNQAASCHSTRLVLQPRTAPTEPSAALAHYPQPVGDRSSNSEHVPF